MGTPNKLKPVSTLCCRNTKPMWAPHVGCGTALPICSAPNGMKATTHSEMESGCLWGAEEAGTRPCYSLAARAAQVQSVQAAMGTWQQMERTATTERALLLLLSTMGSVREGLSHHTCPWRQGTRHITSPRRCRQNPCMLIQPLW